VKALYRIDEVMEILSCSRNTVLNLLAEGKLRGHNDKPGKTGTRITVKSVNEYLDKYELPAEYFTDKEIRIEPSQRKTISKGVE
jgi:excisionase family DNA binding protein